MKKALLVLAALAAAPSFAQQLNWTLETDFSAGLLSWNTPTGEKADKFLTGEDSSRPNNAEYNPNLHDRGDYTYDGGSLDLFSYGRGNWLRPNSLRLSVGFEGEAIAFHLRSLYDPLVSLVDFYPVTSTTANTTDEDHSLVTGSGKTVNWNDFLRYSFDEFYIKGTGMFLTGYLGNTPERGKVADYSDVFTDDLLRTVRVDHYGVITPAAGAAFNGAGTDANNFMSRPSAEPGTVDQYDWVMPYFMFGARLGMRAGGLFFPVSLQIAGDPGSNSGIGGININDANYGRYNASVRFSAEYIADALTFDLIYRIRGGDPYTLDSYDAGYNKGGVAQPDGNGSAAHIFGLYANILGIPNLGVGLGYTGYMVTYEGMKDTETGVTATRKGPLYHGIDLHLQYTPSEKLTLTSVNKFSLAVSDHSDENAVAMGVLGMPNSPYMSQGWLALYNALGVDFHLNEEITATVQAASRWGVITTNESLPSGGMYTVKRSRMQTGGGAYIAVQFSDYFRMQAGVAFMYLNDGYSNDAPGAQDTDATRDARGGAFNAAVPIRISYTFRKQ